MLGIVKSIGTTIRASFRGRATVQYPTEKKELPHRSRGFPVLLYDFEVDEPFCTGCQVCARYCPVDCITVTMKDNPKKEEGKSKRKKIVDKFYLDYARCMRCDICVEVCNFSAIVMNNTWEGIELSKFDRSDLVMDKDALLAQHRKGDLADPFREPMGVAHHGWAPKKVEEGGHAEAIPIAPAASGGVQDEMAAKATPPSEDQDTPDPPTADGEGTTPE